MFPQKFISPYKLNDDEYTYGNDTRGINVVPPGQTVHSSTLSLRFHVWTHREPNIVFKRWKIITVSKLLVANFSFFFFFSNSQEDSWIILLRFFFQTFLLSNNFFLSFVKHWEFSNFGDLVKSYHSIRKFDSFEIKELIDLKSFRGSPRYSQKIFQFKSVRVRLTKYPYFKSIIAASKLIALNWRKCTRFASRIFVTFPNVARWLERCINMPGLSLLQMNWNMLVP